jgi:hypothetical protein
MSNNYVDGARPRVFVLWTTGLRRAALHTAGYCNLAMLLRVPVGDDDHRYGPVLSCRLWYPDKPSLSAVCRIPANNSSDIHDKLGCNDKPGCNHNDNVDVEWHHNGKHLHRIANRNRIDQVTNGNSIDDILRARACVNERSKPSVWTNTVLVK